MTSTPTSHNSGASISLTAFTGYLQGAGWELSDTDERTTLWVPGFDHARGDVHVVLPDTEQVSDFQTRIFEALRAVAYAEQRLPGEVVDDMNFGGADTIAVRLTPDAPSGEAPLGLVHASVGALRNLVVASATALETEALVLPSRRPQRAVAYADNALLSTQPGSFVLTLSLPLREEPLPASEAGALFPAEDIPQPVPFGRRVTDRMTTAAVSSMHLANQVLSGEAPLQDFGRARPTAPNATELAALADLGGPDRELYQLRIARSPLAGSRSEPALYSMNPGQQRIFSEAADYLRTKQPRPAVTVSGFVVRLHRDGQYGKGEAVVEGVYDDTEQTRRISIELDEADYSRAIRAHQAGFPVSATGDLEVKGTRRSLRRLSAFDVHAGIDDD